MSGQKPSQELSVDLCAKIVARRRSGQWDETISKTLSVPRSMVACLEQPGFCVELARRALVREVTRNPTELQKSSAETEKHVISLTLYSVIDL